MYKGEMNLLIPNNSRFPATVSLTIPTSHGRPVPALLP